MKIKITKKIQETSVAAGVAGAAGRMPPFSDKETLKKFNNEQERDSKLKGKSLVEEDDAKLEEMYSSAGIMGMGSGRIPAERNKKAHKRYIRMRFVNQGLQNFKPNRYFAEDKSKKRKIKIKIKKNLEEKCQKGYKTHEKRKTKKMFGKTYRNCVKAE